MKLYIIGNGFDLHHGLKTSYRDYKVFLEEKYKNVAGDFESLANVNSKEIDLWSDIEKALKIDYCNFLARSVNKFYSTGIIERNGIVPMHYLDNPIAQDVFLYIESKTQFIERFNGIGVYEWFKGVENTHIQRKLPLEDEALYLSYNYTSTLERTYKINEQNIYHIHGKIADIGDLDKNVRKNRNNIVRNNRLNVDTVDNESLWNVKHKPNLEWQYVHEILEFGAVIDFEVEYDRINNYYQNNLDLNNATALARDTLCEYIKKSSKDINKNYKRLNSFIDRTDIDTVVVMGHSYDGIDYPYYRDVIVPKHGSKHWIFYNHINEEERIRKFANTQNITDYSIEIW